MPPPPPPSLPHPPHTTTVTAATIPVQPPPLSVSAVASSIEPPSLVVEGANDNVANGPPPRLPPTTFLSKGSGGTAVVNTATTNEGLPILARRQTHLPILVLATEAAHQLAWKNKLRLVDLLEGLSQPLTTAGQQQQQSSSSYPFRSVNRQLQVSDVGVRFIEPEQLYVPHSDDEAQQLLNQHALLQESDGDLAKELTVLEDQVDTLLDEDPYGGEDCANDASSASASSTLQPHGGGDGSQHHSSYVYDRHTRRGARWEQVVRDAHALTSPLHIPWLWRYRVASDHATDQLPWDLMATPIVVLCIATTREMAEQHLGSIGALQSLVQSPYALPRPYHTGLLDPNAVRKEVLVLHDNVDGPRSGDDDGYNEAALRQALLQNFGSNAALVRCNSIPIETAKLLAVEETSDPWGGGGALGTCLSVSDRVSFRKYVAALVSSAVLPAMERRVSDLNAVVSDKKKGVRNVLKSLWGGGRSGAGSSGGGTGSSSHGTSSSGTLPKLEVAGAVDNAPVLYRHDSVESQTRLLADSLFLMKDYEAALGMYRLIRDDYKQDKAHAHYASVQELMALCMYLTDPYGRSKDIFSYCENALMSYSRAAEDERPPTWGEKPGRPASAPRATRLATRLCLVLISTQNVCTDRHLEVGDLLASASSHETSLGAAVLLEQSSSHYFMADMYRKYVAKRWLLQNALILRDMLFSLQRI